MTGPRYRREITALIMSIMCASAASAQDGAQPSAQESAKEAPAEPTPDQRYRRGKSLFEFGDCGPTTEMLAPLAVPGKLQDDRSQLDVHLMLGVCYVLAAKELEASREFSSLLAIDPDFTLDPFLVPPPVIEVYDRQKAVMKEQLTEIRKAREASKASGLDASGGVLLERTTVVKDVPLAAAFMPFGLAQSANGENVKAVVVGSIQGAFFAANAGMYWAGLLTLRGREPNKLTEEELATYNALGYGHLVALVGFTAAYGYGVADALWNREDGEVVKKTQTRRALTPAEIKELKKIAPAPVTAPET